MFFSLSLPLPGRGRGRSGKCFSSVGSRMQRVTTDSFFFLLFRSRVLSPPSCLIGAKHEYWLPKWKKKWRELNARSIPYAKRVQPLSETITEIGSTKSPTRLVASASGIWTRISIKRKKRKKEKKKNKEIEMKIK